jgi:phosphohistidine phosphatase
LKILYLVRHAKTIRGGIERKDFDRYLKERGHQDAELMAKFLKAKHPLPELIITSPAKRAEETTEIFAKIFQHAPKPVQTEKSIYTGDIDDLLNIFFAIDEDINCAMLIGHNPTIHDMVNYFIKSPVYHFPTCCVAGIRFDTEDWQKLKAHRGELFVYEKPKNIR